MAKKKTKTKTPLETRLEEIGNVMNKAIDLGRFMVIVSYVENDRINLFRMTDQFPLSEVPVVLDLLKENLDKEVEEINKRAALQDNTNQSPE